MLQKPELISPLVLGWPQVRTRRKFLQHFGEVAEVHPTQALYADLQPWEKRYFACPSLKFERLNGPEDPAKLRAVGRRMYLDGKGMAKLELSFILSRLDTSRLQTLSEVVQFVMEKRIRLQSPEKKGKRTPMYLLQDSVKRLLGTVVGKADSYAAHTHWLEAVPPMLLLDLSPREAVAFELENVATAYSIGEETLYHLSPTPAQGIEVFCTVSEKQTFENRLLKLHFSRLNHAVRKLEFLLHHQQMDPAPSFLVQREIQHLQTRLFQDPPFPEWEALRALHQQLFPQYWVKLTEGNGAQVDPVPAPLDARMSLYQEILGKMTNGALPEAAELLRKLIPETDFERGSEIDLLLVRINRSEQEWGTGKITKDYFDTQIQRCSAQIIHLFRTWSQEDSAG